MKVLGLEEVKEKLSRIEGWNLEEGTPPCIAREFQTKNWKTTLFVVNAIASLAESQWHHPDLEVSFKKVKVKLTTHEAGGITERDLRLAESLNELIPRVLDPTGALR